MTFFHPRYGPSFIKMILPVLFTSEAMLTFGEKIGCSFGKRRPNWVRDEAGSICCGDNPWLRARIVEGLYVEEYDNTVWRQTLHWIEPAYKEEHPETFERIVGRPGRHCSEDVNFDVLWYGKSFLEEDERGEEAMQVMLEGPKPPALCLNILTGQAAVKVVDS